VNAEEQHIVALDDVDSGGWLEQLGSEIPELDQLCDMIGERFVAFAFIAGIRISSIAYNPDSPQTSLVDFMLGDETEVRRLSLGDFRERLAAVLLAGPDESRELPAQPGADEIRDWIGRRYLLLAPVFDIRLLELRCGSPAIVPTLLADVGQVRQTFSLEELRYVLRDRVREEVERVRSAAPFSIDLRHVTMAETANLKEDYDRTIALLGAWPGPLSLFLRTPQGQALGIKEKAALSKALGILGTAYIEKEQIEWAEEVLRLGVQWGQDTEETGNLYVLLAKARLKSERWGEAIGLLRRALLVGAKQQTVLPLLARCFTKRKRYVAAAVCLDQALAAGVDAESQAETRAEIDREIGEAYRKFRELVPLTNGAGGSKPPDE
jgi:tetratricopeptide (TPR) repeat protein